MKSRAGFISNSSSTSFTFLLKEGSWDYLYQMIEKYHQHFTLWYPGWQYDRKEHSVEGDTLTPTELIEAIKIVAPDCSVISSDEYLQGLNQSIEQYRTYISESPESNYLFEHLMDLCRLQSEVEEYVGAGFTHVIQLNFGDNEGTIEGGKVGIIMDYKGRDINLCQPDFVVLTEQNR